MDINIEERRNRAVDYFLQGYNCSQSVFMAYNDVVGVDLDFAKRLSAPFGAGMGRMREVCGACTGMFMVAGSQYKSVDPTNEEVKTQNYAVVQELAEKFKQQFDTIICADLLKIERFSQDPKPSDRNAQYYAERPCARFVGEAAAIIAKKLLH